jgi:hypothetical protein
MTTQAYLISENNVVTNKVEWDGNPQTWQPPQDSIQLVQSTTPAMIWLLNTEKTAFVLTEVMGLGDIGFTWNGTILTTSEPQPSVPTESQPNSTGTQSA